MKCGDSIIMFGEKVHQNWWHGIPKRKFAQHRISLTYRELNKI